MKYSVSTSPWGARSNGTRIAPQLRTSSVKPKRNMREQGLDRD
jgi:hypothetical protein